MARRSSSAATSGMRYARMRPAPSSQVTIQPSMTGVSSASCRAARSCSATCSAARPASASVRAAWRCSARRSPAGVRSYRACRISGCRNARRTSDSFSSPAAFASSSAAVRSSADRPTIAPRSVTENAGPSSAAARSVSVVSSGQETEPVGDRRGQGPGNRRPDGVVGQFGGVVVAPQAVRRRSARSRVSRR